MITKLIMPLTTEREPGGGSVGHRLISQHGNRGFVVPDASMPGPVARLYPIDADGEDGMAGGDAMGEGESQNQDRI